MEEREMGGDFEPFSRKKLSSEGIERVVKGGSETEGEDVDVLLFFGGYWAVSMGFCLLRVRSGPSWRRLRGRRGRRRSGVDLCSGRRESS
jgi:hypothetical protein